MGGGRDTHFFKAAERESTPPPPPTIKRKKLVVFSSFSERKMNKQKEKRNRTGDRLKNSCELKHWQEERHQSSVFGSEPNDARQMRWFSWKWLDISQLSQRGATFQRKQDARNTWFQCTVAAGPYPSSLGGVYQPGGKHNHIWWDGYTTVSLQRNNNNNKSTTHHSFHESAPGICMTVVLWQDCTGSTRKKKCHEWLHLTH